MHPVEHALYFSTALLHAYTHDLHHKYFEVNYGDALVPFDKWLGTWHTAPRKATRSCKRAMKSARRGPTPRRRNRDLQCAARAQLLCQRSEKGTRCAQKDSRARVEVI